jgi:uncharacterized membrane protein HdeD (DUF308 family)
MANETKSKAVRSVLPWQKGAAWWVVLLEGIFLTGLGLYMFFARSPTYLLLGWVIALSLGASGGLRVYLAYQMKGDERARLWTLIHGAIGLIAAILVVFILILGVYLQSLGLTILGLGCLGYGAVGLYMMLSKSSYSLRSMELIGTIFYLVIGALMLLQVLGVGTLVTMIHWVNLIILVAGVVLVIWAFILRNDSAKKKA